MRILIDARFYGLEHAGLGRYTTNLVEELKKIDKKNEYTIFLRKEYFKKLSFPKNWKKVEVDIRHYTFREQFILPGKIKEYSPDLVHFPHFNVPIFYWGNYVVTVHDLLMHKFKGKETTTLPSFQYLPKRVGYQIAFAKAVGKSKKIFVPSKIVKEEVSKAYSVSQKDIIVTYEGIDDKFRKGAPKDKVFRKFKIDDEYFIYTGNAYPHKNLEKAIGAIVQLNKDRKEKMKFLIAGVRDVFSERLEILVERMEAEGLISLLGFVPDRELVTLYENSQAFVYPSLSEGFGLQGLEAMRSGALVLASNIPVFKEIYGENALFFDPKESDSIKKTMEKAFSMKRGVKDERIKKSQLFIEQYSWKKTAELTLKIYEDSLSLR